ncbi:MAG TPA: bifunctional phosphopantothenoylcysteine decarboxylase/phosphopantothenate--cysteine ligase CoaBC [Pseudomonadales bacterium]
MSSLQNKRIILGISGGIAAYKSAELCRLLQKAGAEVRVVMTAGAQEFITPLTLQALSGNKVHTQLLDAEAEAAMGHIELARWADLILVAPASANFIARLAHGEASDLLTTLCLARRGPLALAPAMNQAMWGNAQTQANLAALSKRGVHVFGPDSGEQACGDVGLGRMSEPQQLVREASALFATGALAGLSVTITAGPTREPIDPVRYISNHSSGKMAYAMARAAAEAGAVVTLVSGPVNLAAPEHVAVVNVDTAQQMLEACEAQACDVFIGVAAVADYRVASPSTQKIKKDAAELTLQLVRNSDILATMAARTPRPFCAGFAAETERLAENARAKLAAKKLDLIFANDASATFGNDAATVTAYWSGGEHAFAHGSKEQLARQMIALLAARLKGAA